MKINAQTLQKEEDELKLLKAKQDVTKDVIKQTYVDEIGEDVSNTRNLIDIV